MNKVPVQIQIPTEDNNKVAFAAAHHAAFEAELTELFNGFSLLPGLVAGGWKHAGAVYPDATMVYVVDVPGVVKAGKKLREMVRFAKAHYGQLKVRITYLGVSEVL